MKRTWTSFSNSFFIALALLCGLSLFSSPEVNAQKTNVVVHFSSDTVVFFGQIQSFMISAREDDGKDFIKYFEPYWYGGRFTEEQRKEIYATTNLMLKKKKRAFPDFRDYFYAVIGFINSETQRPQNFFIWNETLREILENDTRKGFEDYLEFSVTLFDKNMISESKAASWKSDNDRYVFEYDSLPKITFESLTLTCFAKGDSAIIYNTSGAYYPTINTWVGRGGRMDWQRAGFESERVFATFDNYRINTKKTEFVIDTVTFYNKNYFGEEPLKGSLHEKILAATQDGRITYPRFESFNKRLGIKNIYSGVDYEGGFAMHGENFVGKGSADEPSKLLFQRNGEVFFTVMSENFLIKVDRITSGDASVKFYLQEDSIYHPGLQFKYFIDTKQLSLIKDGSTATSMSPYYNSFHQVDMEFEVLNWKTDEAVIEFTNIQGSTQREALFESSNFFSFQRYDKLQGMATVNPLVQIRALSIKLDTARIITLSELAKFMKMPSNQVELLLMDLTTRGFVTYNFEIKEFYIQDRLFNYVYNRAGWKDYDIIQFYSSVKAGSNATLNLNNYDMTIKGIESIFLSDSQQVIIFPAGQEIVLKKNRDFIFAGVVKAGRLDFFGKEFSFEYDNFKVNLTNVDSLRLKAALPETDAYGRALLTPVRSVIEGINGELLIDRPDNKSGRKSLKEYPIFTSFKDSYVFYNKKEILNGAYKKDVYFQLEPFTIDSVDNFSNAGLQFGGSFESGGIFPVFKEILRLQPDYSLGFVRSAPPEGFPVYGGKGQFYNDINLSNNGLRGNGQIDYITSTTMSKDFIFYPDSMITIADSYEIKEQQSGVEFPTVKGGGVKVSWFPNNDVMYTDKRDSALAFYDGKSYLHGRTILRPTGLSGKGVFEFERAELESNLIEFKFKEFDSDTADFRLKDLELAGELSFKTTNVNAHIDFEKRVGQFKSNGGGSFIEFPANQYMSFMEEFNWYMDTEDIELSAGEQASASDSSDVKLEGAEFVSTHPEQDSLNFYSTLAKYDLRQKVITSRGVQYINTADARVIPDSGKVVIRKKALMDPLEKSGIIANTVTKYHNIYNANVNIYGKRSYSGTGYIDYVDELGNRQQIFLEKISVDTTMQTIASGVISSTDGFTLSPYFEYRGAVGLAAKYQYLTFTGATRISHECEYLERNWIAFAAEIDPNAIYIPIEEPLQDQAGEALLSSIMLGGDSSGVYSAFLTKQRNPSDMPVLPADGFLFYDKPSKEYRISNVDKLMELTFPGNYLSLATTSCKVYGEGMVDLGVDLGQMDIRSAGNVIHTLTDDEVILDLFMIINFHFTDNALQEMAKIVNANINLDPVKLDRPNYEKSLKELVGQEVSDKLISDISLYGSFKKFPPELNASLVLNEVRFKYSKETDSYRSFGRIGVGNILKEQVNKYMNGKMEVVKRRGGDIINIYLEAGSGNWFFFTYSRGILFAVSSSEVFNNAITEVKPDKAKLDTKKKETPYKFMITTERKKNDFLKRFEIN